MRVRRIVRTATALVLLGATPALAACGGTDKGAEKALAAFAKAWSSNDLGAVKYDQRTGESVQRDYTIVAGELATAKPLIKQSGKVTVDKSAATGKVSVDWTLSAITKQHWRYAVTVPLRKTGDTWAVTWTPQTVHPDLTLDNNLVVTRTQAERGAITDGADQPIVQNRPVVRIGVVPKEVTNAQDLAKKLGDALKPDGVDTKDLPDRLKTAQPDGFLEVVTLRKERYDQLKAQIYDVPGLQFREDSLPLAPSRDFARALLGTVGPVTKEIIERNPGRYQAGDLVGLGGIQGQYQEILGGNPKIVVSTKQGKELTLIQGNVGAPVATNIDQRIQVAADAATGSQSKRSALVAIRIADGGVVAVSNGARSSVNIAFEASTAPGSTFKAVSALSLLSARKVRMETRVACPKTFTVEGRTFHNDSNFEIPGNVPFREDFARSCNTAFASLAPELGADGLTKTAKTLGLGERWSVGLSAHTGSVPVSNSAADLASASFGQGRVTVSPLAMAAATAAIARGQWTQPVLLRSQAPPAANPGPDLDKTALSDLRTMMRDVVTAGTAQSLKDVPGAPIYGKTGTAEYGEGNPPPSHGWFVGYRGDYAFAVFVEDGGSSLPALEITEKFLRAIG